MINAENGLLNNLIYQDCVDCSCGDKEDAKKCMNDGCYCSRQRKHKKEFKETITKWLDGFNTESAAKCFEAIQILKNSIEYKGDN